MVKLVGATMVEHRREIRSRVFAAFSDLLTERGYEALTLADIAKAIGFTRSAIYTHFNDKEAVLLAFVGYELDEFSSGLRVELLRNQNPVDRLRIFVRAQLTYFATHPFSPGPALRSVLSEAGSAIMERHAATLEAILTGILADAAADGVVPTRVVEDGYTIPLLVTSLTSGRVRGLQDAELEAAIVVIEDYVLRAVGAIDVAEPPAAVRES